MHKTARLRALALSRSLHASSVSRHLVGPNDPVSHLRPIIYTDTPAPHSRGQLESHVNHPYSLHEFTDVQHDHALQLQYNLAREQLDAFNHNYWTDVCRDSVPLDLGSFTHGYARATRGSKRPSNPCWRLFLNPPRLKRVKMHSQSFTRNG